MVGKLPLNFPHAIARLDASATSYPLTLFLTLVSHSGRSRPYEEASWLWLYHDKGSSDFGYLTIASVQPVDREEKM
uniref:Uncharacterized protein n=1 Tax=Sphaerodactylus townsendi TaxID=933632 RepID=A0ACB8EF78_9SAUR